MATDVPANVENLISTALNDGIKPPEAVAADTQPIYKMFADSKVPVSKAAGKLWKSRLDQITQKRKDTGIDDMFDETTRYYRNDQSYDRAAGTAAGYRYSRSRAATTLSKAWSMTENIVFSNVSALVPTLYAKNPDASITPNDTNDENKRQFFKTCEKLIDVLAVKKDAPGLNLRIKGKKGTVHAALYNLGIVELGYVQKSDSSEQAMNDIIELSKKLANAKTPADVKEIEGQLLALEETVDLLSPSGPWAKVVDPRDLLIDPDAQEPDFSDAKFMLRRELLRTAYLNAKFGEKNAKGEVVSIYEPTHVMKSTAASDNVQDEINGFSLFKSGAGETYGYSDKQSYDKACLTECYWIWDKVSRRLMLYANNKWEYPIWVWDDPYELPNFFPFAFMFWLIDPVNAYAKSEISYYLDQQDEINNINSERKRMRDWASGKVVYNKNIVKNEEDVKSLISGDSKVLGLDLAPDADINKVISALAAPSTQYQQLFDTAPIMQSVDRLSSVTAVQRGSEYKTNTTNKAIEQYNSQTQTRADEKIDSIEEWIGEILDITLFMCIRFMPQEQVASLIGAEAAQVWQNLNSNELRALYSIRCVGGSSQKPTSSIKKQQALQLAQVLGQFASASPAIGVVALKMIERSFADDVNITDEDWQMILQSLQQAGSAGAGGNPDEIMNQLDQSLQQLPPQAKQALGKMIASGMPLKEAIAQLAQMTGGQQQRPQQQQPN